jgi:MATE family multidrug resistance protein
MRTLLVLAWPIVVARSSQAVVGFCDALMTAPLGEDALAATTTGSFNAFAVVIPLLGVAFIVQSFASQLKGKGDLNAARRYAWYGLILAVVSGVIAAAAIPFVGPGLGLLAYEEGVRVLMTDYLGWRLLAVGAIVGVEVLGNWYGGLGNTRLHMMAGIITMIVNVFLNWVLIYGNLGAPELGVEGAAIASVIASFIGLAVLLWVFWRGWFIESYEHSKLVLRRSEFVRMLRFGIPNGINWFLEFAAFALFINVVVAHLGTTVLAAMMVVFNINSVSFMPAFGLSSAGAILTGQAIGADQKDAVGGIVLRTGIVAGIWQCTVGVFYVAMPATLMGWFAPTDQMMAELVEVGTVMLALSAAWQLSDAAAMSVSEALRSAGDTAWCMWARLTMAWVVFTPAAVLSVVVWDGGYVAAMVCLIGYLSLLAVVMLWRFRRGAWRDIDLTGMDEELPT